MHTLNSFKNHVTVCQFILPTLITLTARIALCKRPLHTTFALDMKGGEL